MRNLRFALLLAAGVVSIAAIPAASHLLAQSRQTPVANVRVASERGLSREAAIRALTLDAATLSGAGARLGSIERGKRANLLVTEGDLLDAKVKIKHVFVGGRMIAIRQ